MKTFKIGTLTMLPLTLAISTTALADQVYNDDLIVGGSACVGIDCSNGENFGFDTIRLKENNLRIKFDDTSVSSSFPRNDWQITINDSVNGGAEKFAIDDITNNKTPFTIEGNAPANTLYVDSNGHIGVKTNAPLVDIHVKEGNTPTLRLEQDGSAGFTSQSWDVAGNEAGFFIRDVTNSSNLPFRIKPGAPSNSIFVNGNGDVGLGTDAPAASLHIRNSISPTALRIENPLYGDSFVVDNNGNLGSGTLEPSANVDIENVGEVKVELNDTSTGDNGQWSIIAANDSNANPGFSITRHGSGTREFRIDSSGNVYVNAALVHPDYVFEKDYPLMPISELEAFINEKKHLPEIPSANNVNTSGLNLSALPQQILKKVEELTLYTIEQDKQIKHLTGLVESQQTELNQLKTTPNSKG
ncbi:hypothetical protein [Shewanella waksmanii]|uniref:hypothetical protein n=1 Tax=Shewanella waksmanii TaxID=213783 RepID=UPI003736C05F